MMAERGGSRGPGVRLGRGRLWGLAWPAWPFLSALSLLGSGQAQPDPASFWPADTTPVLRVGQASATSGSRVALTVRLEGEGVRLGSLDAVLRFDPAALLPTEIRTRSPMELGETGMPGRIAVRTAGADSARITPGRLLELSFRVLGSSGLRVPVTIEVLEARDVAGNDVTGRVVLRDGSVWIRELD